MQEWNVIATVREGGYQAARRLLKQYGSIGRTPFRDVVVLNADHPESLLDTLSERVHEPRETTPSCLGRVIPVTRTFVFQSPEEFETKAREAALTWVGPLAGKSFHARMHRRGFKGRISSQKEEILLDQALLEALQAQGTPGRITFEDPDAILSIETLGQEAGLSLWTREDLRRYADLLHLD